MSWTSRWVVVLALALPALCVTPAAATAAETITVSSTAGTLGAGPAGHCTLRDALVVADSASNPALTTSKEPGGSGAAADCAGETSGSGAPYTIVLASGATYPLTAIDNHWFGPDGLAPISDTVTIDGSGATIERSGATAFRFFYVSGGLSGIPAGSLTLQNLALSNGLARGGDGGSSLSGEDAGGGAGMGGAIFDQGAVTLSRVTLSDNEALGGNPDNPSVASGGGGGIGQTAPSDSSGGGFGGFAPGASGGAGGGPGGGSTGGGGGGGGFRTADAGANGSASGGGGAGGGLGQFGSGAHDGGNGGHEMFGGAGSAGGAFGSGGLGYASTGGSGTGGGGGVGGGGGDGVGFGGGGGGGFGGGGGDGTVGGHGGFGGGGGSGFGGPGAGGLGGFGAGDGTTTNGGGGAGMGGAIFSMFGQVTVSDSTLSGDSAVGGSAGTAGGGTAGGAGSGLGGALFNLDGTLTINGSTIAGDGASGVSPEGGGIYAVAFGNVITTGGETTATVALGGSIVYGNAGGHSLFIENSSGGHLSGVTLASATIVGSTGTANGATVSGTPITSNPMLGPLQNNGGSLQTMRPGAGSPALGAGSSCDATDELGAARPANGCDLGALELTLAPPAASATGASNVSTSSATLNGQVDANGGQTTDEFELSTSSSFSSFVTIAAGAASGTANMSLSANASGLTPASLYYYRLIASNSGSPGHYGGGTTTSSVAQFSTQTPTKSTTLKLGNRKFTLTYATEVCTASGGRLPASLTSAKRHSSTKTKLVRAEFWIDKGVKHKHHHRAFYDPNATKTHLPASLKISFSGLKPGHHTLKVILTYRQGTSTLTKTIKVKFVVC